MRLAGAKAKRTPLLVQDRPGPVARRSSTTSSAWRWRAASTGSSWLEHDLDRSPGLAQGGGGSLGRRGACPGRPLFALVDAPAWHEASSARSAVKPAARSASAASIARKPGMTKRASSPAAAFWKPMRAWRRSRGWSADQAWPREARRRRRRARRCRSAASLRRSRRDEGADLRNAVAGRTAR